MSKYLCVKQCKGAKCLHILKQSVSINNNSKSQCKKLFFQLPKLYSNSNRICEDKDRHVLSDGHDQHEEDDLHEQDVEGQGLEVAEPWLEGSEEDVEDLERLEGQVVDDHKPAGRHRQLKFDYEKKYSSS